MNNMPVIGIVIAAFGALASCGPAPEERCAEGLAKLEALRHETNANIIRQQGECRAVAAEFPGDKMILDSCLETLRFVIDTAQSTEASILKRLSEPDMQQCTATKGAQ